jgi:hypothetical protein
MPLTATGVLLVVVVPFPNFPKPLSPQQSTPPVASSAHVWLCLAVMAVAFVMPLTATGAPVLPVVVPFPNCPEVFKPQQSTPPPAKQKQHKSSTSDD